MRIVSFFQQLMTDPLSAVLYLLISFFAMCVAISFHEWAHAFAAYKLGDPTARNLGRMTIDPFAHIDLLGAVMFVVFGFGWAKPVIVNSRNLKHYRRDDVIISLAGPAMNLFLGFVFCGLLVFVSTLTDEYYIRLLLNYLAVLNLNFAVFNIIPIYPLDGFHVVTSIFVRKHYGVVEFLRKYGSYILLILILTDIIDIVVGWAVGGLYDLFTGLFIKLFF
ncbi:MAG: site-2 protease family protein [Clostridia bacterium]|nr:site-2 protease family protein [Clostridia bacterium]